MHYLNRNRSEIREGDRNPQGPQCAFFQDRLHAYIEMELDATAARFIANHLSVCPACRVLKDRLERERLEFLNRLVIAPALPAGFSLILVEKLESQEALRNVPLRRNRLSRWRFPIGLAAGILLGIGVTLLLLPTHGGRLSAGRSDPFRVEPAPVSPHRVAGAPEIQRRLVELPQEDARPAIRAPSGVQFRTAQHPGAGFTPGPRMEGILEDFAAHSDPQGSIFQTWENIMNTSPCTKDLNQDGLTDVSDAIHLLHFSFLLAVPTSGPTPGDELVQLSLNGLDCSRFCEL